MKSYFLQIILFVQIWYEIMESGKILCWLIRDKYDFLKKMLFSVELFAVEKFSMEKSRSLQYLLVYEKCTQLTSKCYVTFFASWTPSAWIDEVKINIVEQK